MNVKKILAIYGIKFNLLLSIPFSFRAWKSCRNCFLLEKGKKLYYYGVEISSIITKKENVIIIVKLSFYLKKTTFSF